uniref:Uncharacterized protein n=1 Tax=Arundo donax TaxID=35708 RepID=A0A0A9G782_ARUDO
MARPTLPPTPRRSSSRRSSTPPATRFTSTTSTLSFSSSRRCSRRSPPRQCAYTATACSAPSARAMTCTWAAAAPSTRPLPRRRSCRCW